VVAINGPAIRRQAPGPVLTSTPPLNTGGAVVEVGVQRPDRGRAERHLGPPVALAEHGQDLVPAVRAEVADVRAEGFVDAQGVVQQQPDHRRGPQPRTPGVGVGRDDQGAALLPGQADRPCSRDRPTVAV
jgi:hypothetical protein